MSVLHLNKENFEQIKSSEKRVLLDFYATWCGPCKMIAPVLEEVASEHPEYLIAKINVDEAGEIAREWGIASIPTLVVLDNGEERAREVGYKPKADILKLLEV